MTETEAQWFLVDLSLLGSMLPGLVLRPGVDFPLMMVEFYGRDDAEQSEPQFLFQYQPENTPGKQSRLPALRH